MVKNIKKDSKKDIKKIAAPCGSWPSAITPELAASAAGALDYPTFDSDYVYWLESRPEDNGRNTIMRMPRPTQVSPTQASPKPSAIEEVLPSPLNARSRVHEYGGKPYTVKDNILYFVLQDDQCIYRLDTAIPDALPEVLTSADQGLRFAELCLDTPRNRLIAVCEQHQGYLHGNPQGNLQENPQQEPENFIAAIPLDGSQTLDKLVTGADFYAYPRLNPDGSHLAWISWQHPHMPWDNTTLEIAEFDTNGAIGNIKRPLGNSEQSESLVQPNWAADGSLFFVSDRSEWWNIYRLSAEAITSDKNHEPCLPLHALEAEFATPLWTLGMSNYGISEAPGKERSQEGSNSDSSDRNLSSCSVIASYTQDGLWHLARVDISINSLTDNTTSAARQTPLTPIETPYSQLSSLAVKGNRAWFIGSSPQRGSELVELDIATQGLVVLRNLDTPSNADQNKVNAPDLDREHFSQPQALRYPTTNHDTAYGFYYPPTNPGYTAVKSETPPLIALCHGGPTGATSTALNYKVQFWTSRGFAVANFNYRGSTGFGRSYRNKLHGNWGRADVDDVVAGVAHLCERGLADPARLLIRGSSAGGYTVLAALTFSDVFRAGASLYGIGDLETLARDTHKFEARYLDSLVGPYPASRSIYVERSPIHHVENLNCPVIFFQGLDDKVVPPNQAMAMVDALKAKELDVIYVPFAGEGHGFRRAENVARVFREELAFYQRILGIATTP
ncbi:MAG: prolyl oligopeptidase family serine peptidase [Porticoccaceae bacterium]